MNPEQQSLNTMKADAYENNDKRLNEREDNSCKKPIKWTIDEITTNTTDSTCSIELNKNSKVGNAIVQQFDNKSRQKHKDSHC